MKLISKIINRIGEILKSTSNVALQEKNAELRTEIKFLERDIESTKELYKMQLEYYSRLNSYVHTLIMEIERRGSITFKEFIEWHNTYNCNTDEKK